MKTKEIIKRKRFIYVSRLALASIFILIAFSVKAQDNIATKLGYAANAKLLIIHADDLGVSHSENMASIEAIENGSVNSASLMMPTPWVLEVANYAKKNATTHDFGLHLVLSSEWKNYRWGPVSSIEKVPSLINEFGYFHEGCTPTVNVKEVEVELKAQIDRAYSMGFEPTHLDSHMNCLFQSEELIEVYLKMGKLYKLPVLATKQAVPEELLRKYDIQILLEEVLTIMPEEYIKGPEDYYINAIKNLKPGLSTFLIHTAYNNDEMKGMNIDNTEWGNEWRQKDFDFFTSDTCKNILKEENIILVTWRQVKDAFYSN
ncbi:polysaccharide deacetylase family protein [Lutibacter flavus]|uniref:YdjC-like protein n=1 Tax=Lutibacter flavus TaxID=691689 RepID=A0A238VV10_9FLAO|nr:polysaccharide deacetylase family protein [Lutibacter flavus]SNR38021.1 hypothetical protein SAMN04488111_1063 [Lutibacter flavus]